MSCPSVWLSGCLVVCLSVWTLAFLSLARQAKAKAKAKGKKTKVAADPEPLAALITPNGNMYVKEGSEYYTSDRAVHLGSWTRWGVVDDGVNVAIACSRHAGAGKCLRSASHAPS